MHNGCGCDWRPAQELVGRHRLLAGTLQFNEAYGAGPAGDGQYVVQYLAGWPAAAALGRSQNLDAPGAGEFAPGAGKRRQPAAMIVDFVPRLGPIDARLALGDLVGIGRAA